MLVLSNQRTTVPSFRTSESVKPEQFPQIIPKNQGPRCRHSVEICICSAAIVLLRKRPTCSVAFSHYRERSQAVCGPYFHKVTKTITGHPVLSVREFVTRHIDRFTTDRKGTLPNNV